MEEVVSEDYRETSISRRRIWELVNLNKPKNTLVDINYVRTKLGLILKELSDCVKEGLIESDLNRIAKDIAKSYQGYQTKWRAASFRSDKFEKKNADWANKKFKLPLSLMLQAAAVHEEPGEEVPDPRSSFEQYSERTQRRKLQQWRESVSDFPVNRLLKAVSGVAKFQKESASDEQKKYLDSVAYICSTATKSPNRPQKIVSCIQDSKQSFKRYTVEESLALIIDQGKTKDNYADLREDNPNIFPPYYLIEKEKLLCYPDDQIHCTKTEASVSLKGLLDHTTRRIVKLQESPEHLISGYAQAKGLNEISLDFFFAWGFDGSSGQATYKQAMDCDGDSDESLFATTVIPLRLVDPKNPHRPMWQNPAPQSVRYCRPLRLQFVKETDRIIRAEKQWVDEQIEQLEEYEVRIHDGETEILLRINYKLKLTLIDGKVLKVITNTSSYQSCPLCGDKPSTFHDLNKRRKVNPTALQHGLSPLHAWIRVFEFLLHLGYKNDTGIRVRRILKKSPVGERHKLRRDMIKSRIKKELGLTVDAPRFGGAGSTNDGNTARMVLCDKNRKKFAEILGLEEWLLDDLHVILTVLSCGLEIDAEKFGSFCDSLAQRYVQSYDWNLMTATIHKILAHGKEVISTIALPIGMLSEQASESCNKIYKLNRRVATPKSSREDTMLALFRRSLESSDPIVSDFRLERRKKKLKKLPISAAALNLLKPIDIEDGDDFDGRTVAEDISRAEEVDFAGLELSNEVMDEVEDDVDDQTDGEDLEEANPSSD